MQKFINFYSWGVNMKFHMGIYAVALIFFNGLARWLMGERTIPILALVEMALAAAAPTTPIPAPGTVKARPSRVAVRVG